MAKIAASARDAFYEGRRRELAEAALRLWAKRGFDATSVAEIAEAAGVAKGTFYLYFSSKQALLEDVLRRYSLLPNIEELAAGVGDSSLEDAVHAFVRAAWRHLDAHRDLVLLAMRELPGHLPHAQEFVAQILVPANRLIAAYLEKRLGPERSEAISLVVAGRGLIGMVITMFLTQEILGAGRHLPVSEEAITTTIAQVFLRGVLGSGKDAPC